MEARQLRRSVRSRLTETFTCDALASRPEAFARGPVRALRLPIQYAQSYRRLDHWPRPDLNGTISALCCYVPKIDGLPDGESGCVTDDPPCDFVAHIAQRLGVDRGAAQATLREWLIGYDPKSASPLAVRLATGT